jgi:hypothetical protein
MTAWIPPFGSNSFSALVSGLVIPASFPQRVFLRS